MIASLTPNSFFIAEIVATHGVYNSTNIIKLIADVVVNNVFTYEYMFSLLKIVSVLITASLAVIPTINDVTILQSLIPIGMKNGDIFFSFYANILFSSSV